MTNKTALAELIETRLAELGVDRQSLGFRLGYTNPAKAAGSVQALCDGHIHSAKRKAVLRRLPDAIEVSPDTVDAAAQATAELQAELKREAGEVRKRACEGDWADWCARFTPHAVLEGERTVPNGITFFGISGGSRRWLIISLDVSKPEQSFVEQVHQALPERLHWPSASPPQVPFFGKATGYVINYAPDRAVRYDLQGDAMETLERAVRVGDAIVSLGRGAST